MTIQPCPHCGHQTGIYRTCPAGGMVEEQFNSDGVLVEIDTDRVTYRATEILRCQNCSRIRGDVVIYSGEIHDR